MKLIKYIEQYWLLNLNQCSELWLIVKQLDFTFRWYFYQSVEPWNTDVWNSYVTVFTSPNSEFLVIVTQVHYMETLALAWWVTFKDHVGFELIFVVSEDVIILHCVILVGCFTYFTINWPPPVAVRSLSRSEYFSTIHPICETVFMNHL